MLDGSFSKTPVGVNSRCRGVRPYGARAAQQTESWEWKQVDGTEIKDPLRLPYIMASCASAAVVKSAQFDISIQIVNRLSTCAQHQESSLVKVCLLFFF